MRHGWKPYGNLVAFRRKCGSRTLSSFRDRLVTLVMTPFMSCGARLPVYALFAAAFFPENGGLFWKKYRLYHIRRFFDFNADGCPVDIAYQTVYACISDCCRLSQIVISLDKGKLWNNDCGNFVIPSTMSYVEINRFATKRKILNNFLICKTMWNHSSTLVIGTFQVVFSSSQTSIFTGASCQPEISKYSIKTSGKMTHIH